MKKSNISDALLKGSKELDQMKVEIKQCVDIMLGLAKKALADFEEEKRIVGAHGYWKLNNGVPGGERIRLEYHWDTGFCIGHAQALKVEGSAYTVSMYAEYVQDVRDDIEVLIQGMLDLFPDIEQTSGWKAIMRAANKASAAN